jgi:hypothetical protein
MLNRGVNVELGNAITIEVANHERFDRFAWSVITGDGNFAVGTGSHVLIFDVLAEGYHIIDQDTFIITVVAYELVDDDEIPYSANITVTIL